MTDGRSDKQKCAWLGMQKRTASQRSRAVQWSGLLRPFLEVCAAESSSLKSDSKGLGRAKMEPRMRSGTTPAECSLNSSVKILSFV